jgi:hypothetical protein
MAAVKLIKFLGEAPKISSELLPDGAAQYAYNVKLYSGDLLPYRTPVIVGNADRNGLVQKLHALRDPSTGDLVWLTWAGDIDIAVASDSSDSEQRFYYTGDGVPKVSNYELATAGAPPYPVSYYELGLPIPETTPSITAVSVTVSNSTHYERDSGNTATFYTGSAHNLTTGNIVTVRDFGTSDEAKGFNAKNVEITVTSATTFQYFSPGDAVSKTANTSGRADLAGNTQIRTYLYTWITPWGEESIPSTPSNEVYIKEGQTVTVADLPSAKPAGDTFIRGINLYRSVVSSATTDFFKIRTLWFPNPIESATRTSNVVTMTFEYHHNMIVDDRFRIAGASDSSFDGDFVVDVVVDDTTIKYVQVASDSGTVSFTSGTAYYDVAETLDDTARYWGQSSYNFTDDFNISGLTQVLPSEDYDPPPSGMRGLKVAANNILVGFFDNQLCFSFPDTPHAWPEKYRITFDAPIVDVESVAGFIVVLTEEYPYQVSGSDPATMVAARIDTLYPCLSKRSVVNMGYGVVWSTHGGLAVYSPSTGIDLITKFVHDWDTWNEKLDPSELIGHFYNGKYFGSHTAGSFIFERDDKVGGYFVSIDYRFTAAYNEPRSGVMYYIGDTTGNIYAWDNEQQVLSPLEWKSKTIVTKDYMNLGAARVIADYQTPDAESANIAAYNLTVPPFNNAVWAKSIQLGCINGPTDYLDAGARVVNFGTLNSFPVNGDGQTRLEKDITGVLPITFKLWADKTLVFQGTVQTNDIFRLPTGFRSDTFEVGVSGSARIRAIHIGETPFGLRTA